MQKLWINGQRQSDLQGKHCNAFDRGLTYGDGMFATMRVDSHGQIQFFDTHIQRLTQAAFRLNVTVDNEHWKPSVDLISLLKQIAAEYPSHGIKVLISRGKGGRGYQAPETTVITEVISTFVIPKHYLRWQQQGIKLCSAEIRLAKQPLLAGIKHLNRLEQVLIKSQHLSDEFQDWLVMDYDDHIVESSMANIFFFDGDKWLTPDLSKNGVSGVMREQIIQQLLELGFNVEVTTIPKHQLSEFQCAFICNSLFGVVDLVQIDDQLCSINPITAEIRERMGVWL